MSLALALQTLGGGATAGAEESKTSRLSSSSAPVFGPRGGRADKAIQASAQSAANNGTEFSPHRYHPTAVEGIQNEQPWHTMAAYLIANGCSNKEVAEAAGVIPGTVAVLKAQRWFQEKVATIVNRKGKDVTALFQAEAVASLNKLVNLRDSSDSERIQLTAAQTLLEHAVGKPTQKIVSNVTHNTGSTSPQDEMADIKAELATLRNRA